MTAHQEGAWDRAARVYARQEHLEQQSVARAVELAAARPDDHLLDVATGTGLLLRTLADRAARPERAVGVDRSPGMLERAGPLPDGWSTVLGDATELPFDEATFDVVTCAYLLQVLGPDDRARALRELHRVLRPGGRLVLVTTWSARAPARLVLAGLAAAAPASLIGLHPHDPRPLLRGAGFSLERASVLRRGYPSVVALARRA